MPDFLDDKEQQQLSSGSSIGLGMGSSFRPKKIGYSTHFGSLGVRVGTRELDTYSPDKIEPYNPELQQLREQEKSEKEIKELNKNERKETSGKLQKLTPSEKRRYIKAERHRSKVSRDIKETDERVKKIKSDAADKFSKPEVFGKLTVSVTGEGTIDTRDEFRTWWEGISKNLPPMPSMDDREAMDKWEEEVEQFKIDHGYHEKLAWVRANRKMERELTKQNKLNNEFNEYNRSINDLTAKATGTTTDKHLQELAVKEKQVLGARYDEKNRQLKPFNYQANKESVPKEQFNSRAKTKEVLKASIAEKENPKPSQSKPSARETARGLAKKYLAEDTTGLLTTDDKAVIIKYLLEGDMPELDKRLLLQFMRKYVTTNDLFLIFTKKESNGVHIDPALFTEKMKDLKFVEKLLKRNKVETGLLGHSLKSERKDFHKKKKEIKKEKREEIENHPKEDKADIRKNKREELRDARKKLTTSKFNFIRDYNYNKDLLVLIGSIKENEDERKDLKERQAEGEKDLDVHLESIEDWETYLHLHKNPEELSFLGKQKQFLFEHYAKNGLSFNTDLITTPFRKEYIEAYHMSQNVKDGADKKDELWNCYQELYGNSPKEAKNVLGHFFNTKDEFLIWLDSNPDNKNLLFTAYNAKVGSAYGKPGDFNVKSPYSGALEWGKQQGKGLLNSYYQTKMNSYNSFYSQHFSRLEKPLMYGGIAVGILEVAWEQAIKHQDYRTYFNLLNAYLKKDFKLWTDTLEGTNLYGDYIKKQELMLSLKKTDSMGQLENRLTWNKNPLAYLPSGKDIFKADPKFYASLIYKNKNTLTGLDKKDPSSTRTFMFSLDYYRTFGTQASQQPTNLYKANWLFENINSYRKGLGIDETKFNADMKSLYAQGYASDSNNVGATAQFDNTLTNPRLHQNITFGGTASVNFLQGVGHKSIGGVNYDNPNLFLFYSALHGNYKRSNAFFKGDKIDASVNFSTLTTLGRGHLDKTYGAQGVPKDVAYITAQLDYMVKQWSIKTNFKLDFTGASAPTFDIDLARKIFTGPGTMEIRLGMHTKPGVDPKHTFHFYSAGLVFTLFKIKK